MQASGIDHLHVEVSHASSGQQSGAVFEEGHVWDGFIVQLGKVQSVDCHEYRLLLLFPESCKRLIGTILSWCNFV